MKRPSELKRMSDKALSKYKLDLENEVRIAVAALSLAKREQRQRRQRKNYRKKCGRPAPMELHPPHATMQ